MTRRKEIYGLLWGFYFSQFLALGGTITYQVLTKQAFEQKN